MIITKVFRVTADLVSSDEELEEMNDYLEITGAEIVDYYFDHNGDQMFITEHYVSDDVDSIQDIIGKITKNINNDDIQKDINIDKNIYRSENPLRVMYDDNDSIYRGLNFNNKN